jgi:hypothetical protein
MLASDDWILRKDKCHGFIPLILGRSQDCKEWMCELFLRVDLGREDVVVERFGDGMVKASKQLNQRLPSCRRSMEILCRPPLRRQLHIQLAV